MKQTEREIKNFFLSINFYVHNIRIKKKKRNRYNDKKILKRN